ncbi:MAG: DNA primase [Treponema sp.]|nr:DNA primase [Spirochaetia bacterium]MDD7013728.1 DNA primase [Spirochaetales bacterium]MDY4901677.1 DNA primase [Treponema sp.]
MPRFIKQESIDEVAAKTDIVSVIGEYVPLTQKGNDWWGCCPFHHEKTPSFSVSVDKKFFYCFGCHASGTVFNFLMNIDRMSYPEAVETLARRAGVVLEYSEGGNSELKEDPSAKLKAEYINLYNRVTVSFHYMLTNSESGKFALDYITKRGITKETIEKFKLGYSPADRKWLRSFLESKNFSKEFLDNSGLFSKKYPEYSFFSDRLMFPIFNKNGEVVAMGGRFLRGDSENSPKYLNSGELIQYKKRETLYAFNFARQSIRENKKVIFCEGYMDCIAYHQCGIEYAVAPLGTALTEEQINIVKPFIDTVYLSFDSDSAGQNATKRAILMCRKAGLTVKIIQIKGGKDPAEIMLAFGKEVLTNEVNNAILDNDYLLLKLLELYPKESPEGKTKASLEFFSYIDSLQSDIQKNACLEQLCRTYEISLEAVKKDYENKNSAHLLKNNQHTSDTKQKLVPKLKNTAELNAVIMAVSDNENLFQKMRSEISVDDLEDPWAKKLYIIMEECTRSGNFSLSNILTRCDSEELKNKIIEFTAENKAGSSERDIESVVLLLKKNVFQRQSVEINNKISRLERSSLPEDKLQITELIAQKMDLSTKIEMLKKGINDGTN